MSTSRHLTFVLFAWLLATASHAQTAFLQGREITVRWMYFDSPTAETNFVVNSQNGSVEAAGFPDSGGPVSIDIQDTDDAHATVLIRWINQNATSISSYLEFTGFTPYSHLDIVENNWLGVSQQSLQQSTNGFIFHVGAYPGLNSPDFFVRLELVRILITTLGPPSSQRVTLSVSGKVGGSYQLQTASDPVSGTWTNVASFTMATGATNILDASATNFARRFYRVISP